jgi:hypothetical protein
LRSIEPARNDQNLRELAGHVRPHLFFAHMCAAIGSDFMRDGTENDTKGWAGSCVSRTMA